MSQHIPAAIMQLKRKSELEGVSVKGNQKIDSDERNVDRYEAEGDEWIEDHTGVKRKPFK